LRIPQAAGHRAPCEFQTIATKTLCSWRSPGYTNAEIGKRLFISPRTVEIHRANMLGKLGLRNQAELIRFALRRGILSNE
jgi:two-component system, NarL family, response regulator NreC